MCFNIILLASCEEHDFNPVEFTVHIFGESGVMSWPKVSTCCHILKPTMNKWAQYPAIYFLVARFPASRLRTRPKTRAPEKKPSFKVF